MLLREMDAQRRGPGAAAGDPRRSGERAGRPQQHPDRLLGSFLVDPVRGMETVRALESAVRELGVVAAELLPVRLRAAGADR